MALPVHCAAISSRAEGPEGCGRARKVQTDVPEWIYRCGNPTRERKKKKREREEGNSITIVRALCRFVCHLLQVVMKG